MLAKTISTIVISAENRAALEESLGILKGRAKVFPTAEDLLYHAADAEKRLDRSGVAASNRTGCLYEYREAGPEANSYKYAKKVVSLALKRTGKGWVVVRAGAEDVFPKQGSIDRISLTPKAKDAVIRAALRPFGFIEVQAA